jgi:Putative Flp pilus-assembly TadE/G-like
MPRRRSNRAQSGCCERGQASLLMLAVVGALLAGAVVLFAFGNALGAKGRYQRAADLAAISAAQVMRDLYPRLFEPPFVEPDVLNPRHLEEAEYRALAVAAAVRGGRRNGVEIDAGDVTFPGADFAPTRVRVRVRGEATVRLPGRPRLRGDTRVRSVGREPARGGSGRDAFARVPIRARATAELLPDAGGAGLPDHASGGGYDGPLAYRQGKPTPRLFSAL